MARSGFTPCWISWLLNRTERRFELDRTTSGAVDFSKVFPGVQTAPWQGTRDHVRLRIFLDQSSIEVFINEGETVLTSLVFPTTPYDSVTLKGSGAIGLKLATVYELKSIWN